MALYKTYTTMGIDPNEPKPESMADVHHVTSKQDRDNIIASNKIVVIDNYTDWCGPCKQCAPQYAVLAKTYNSPGLCVLVKEDVDTKIGGHPVPIRGVPCFHFYINGFFQKDMVVTGADINLVEQTLAKLLK